MSTAKTSEPSLRTHVFLFTDIESSTRLWQSFPDAMQSAIQRHDAILSESVEGREGTVVKTTGDGLMAVFSSAADGVVACLEAQKRLREAQWGEVGPLPVRMGMHVGDAIERAGDFFGTPVNRAARIMAAGHGGQILLSALAAGLAEGRVPPEIRFRDLGEHRLKDLFQPEHIFQVTHPDLDNEFPPLATLSHRPNNLPTQTSEFFGRETQLGSIRQLLGTEGVRLLTLTGPGGIGKTRLALQAAADQIDRFDDGVYFVDLAPIRDPGGTFDAAVRALELTSTTDEQPLVVLKRELRNRHMLLLLDNFEQVIDAAGGVAELLQHCPGLKVLVTSREALRVRGEHLFPVPPMTVPNGGPPPSAENETEYEAVHLFVERARESQPAFELTEHNAAAVAEISSRLDGLPLAIELAASRLRLFSPDELRDRLRSRLDVLGGGARDLPARQRTLRSTIEWSYELLDGEERAVFQVCSIFAPTRIAAIEGVIDHIEPLQGIDVIDRLMSLVDKSLVRSVEIDGQQRLSMLETIREFASERLEDEPGLANAARRAHAEYFAEFAERRRNRLYGAERETTLAELESEQQNLMKAWQYWADAGDLRQLNRLLDSVWVLNDARGLYHAAVELTNDLIRILSAVPETAERTREEITLRISLARGLMALRGYTEEVEEIYTRALTLSEEVGELPQQFSVLRSIASFYLFRGEFDKSEHIGRRILSLAEEQGDVGPQVEGHLVFGASLAFNGNVPAGIEHLDRAIAVFDPSRSSRRFHLGPSPGVTAHTASAFLSWFTGYPARAAELAAKGLALARQLNHPYTLAYAFFHVGFLDLLFREFDRVHEHATVACEVAREHDYPVWSALGLILQGTAMSALGRSEEGFRCIDQGVALYQGLTTPPLFWPLVLYVRALGFGLGGRAEYGLELINQALNMVGNEVLYPELAVLKGDLLVMVSDPDEAESWYQSASEIGGKRGTRMSQLRAATKLTRLRRASGKTPDGSELLRDVYETFTEGFDMPHLVQARNLLNEETS